MGSTTFGFSCSMRGGTHSPHLFHLLVKKPFLAVIPHMTDANAVRLNADEVDDAVVVMVDGVVIGGGTGEPNALVLPELVPREELRHPTDIVGPHIAVVEMAM